MVAKIVYRPHTVLEAAFHSWAAIFNCGVFFVSLNTRNFLKKD